MKKQKIQDPMIGQQKKDKQKNQTIRPNTEPILNSTEQIQ